MQATGRVRFYYRFLFASYRDTDWNATRDFVLGKKGYNSCCVCRRWLNQIRSIQKKREILTRTRWRYIFPKRVQNRSKSIPRCVFRTFRASLLGIWFRATLYARGKDWIVRKRRFFVFRGCNPRQHLEGHVWTRFGSKKKKKRTDPFTSSFSHTKNIIYN